jgi:hypothetical protein
MSPTPGISHRTMRFFLPLQIRNPNTFFIFYMDVRVLKNSSSRENCISTSLGWLNLGAWNPRKEPRGQTLKLPLLAASLRIRNFYLTRIQESLSCKVFRFIQTSIVLCLPGMKDLSQFPYTKIYYFS